MAALAEKQVPRFARNDRKKSKGKSKGKGKSKAKARAKARAKQEQRQKQGQKQSLARYNARQPTLSRWSRERVGANRRPQKQAQIPFGNDKQERQRRRFPSGMTNKKGECKDFG
ncbi:MAG TPA: hypothetical protein VFW30_13950 [Bryocella sp.]|nr:hypothetical protein [Bryocella sp.]